MKLKSFLENCWLFFTGFGLLIIADLGMSIYTGTQVYTGHGLEQFRLGSVDIPKFLGAGATYLEVFITDVVTLICLTVALFARYRYYTPERELLKRYNKEGNTGFLDDLDSDSYD